MGVVVVTSQAGRVPRRSVFAAVGGAGLAVLAGADRATAAGSASSRAMTFLDLMMDAYLTSGRLRLSQSYTDQVGLYATGFTYDNAMAILAYLADTRPASRARARLLGDALVYAQNHDPDFADGRLREAYNAGPYIRGDVAEMDGFVHPDGTVNVGGAFGFVGSGTGEQAWAGLALCALFRRTGERRYLVAAQRLGRWIVATCGSDGPLGGFRAGIARDAIRRLTGQSTEQNAGLIALFGQLARLTGDRAWLDHRAAATMFVTAMWNPAGTFFASGSPDGRTVASGPVALDSQTHALLALAEIRYLGCLGFVARELMVTDTPQRPNSTLPAYTAFTGVTFSTASRHADPQVPIEPGLPKPDPYAVWFEGTAQYACALAQTPGGPFSSAAIARLVAAAQARLGAGQTAGGHRLPNGTGVVAASSPLHVGLFDSGYYPARHVGATAWFVLAMAGVNPLR